MSPLSKGIRGCNISEGVSSVCTVTVMQSSRVYHCALLMLSLTFTTAPVSSAVCSVLVKLHQSVTLPCESNCSPRLAKWAMYDNRDEIYAQCNQTSCWSKDRYEMSHVQYLKGELSLIITTADYSMRNTYACECGISEMVAFRLSIETEFSAVQIKSGEDLILDLSTPQLVAVMYKPRGSADSEQICNVTRDSVQCKPEYTPRASVRYPNFTLKAVSESDTGTYTIRDTVNKDDLRVYDVPVKDERFSWWGILLIVLVVILLLVVIKLIMKYRAQRGIIKVSKKLEEVNKHIHVQGESNDKVEAALSALEAEYRGSEYSEQVLLFCEGKRTQFGIGEEQGLLLTERRGEMVGKMEKVMKSLKQDPSSISTAVRSQVVRDLSEIEQWCRDKRTKLNNLKHL